MSANQEELVNVFVATMRGGGLGIREAKGLVEKEYLRQMLFVCKGNKCKAARKLGVHRNTLSRMVTR